MTRKTTNDKGDSASYGRTNAFLDEATNMHKENGKTTRRQGNKDIKMIRVTRWLDEKEAGTLQRRMSRREEMEQA